MHNELSLPKSIHEADRAEELTRIWIVDGKQYVVLSPDLWDDPATWGLMLVDIARHVSKAYQKHGKNETEVLARIKKA